MDIYQLKPQVSGKLCIIGKTDVDLSLRSTPAEISEETKEHLRRLGRGGSYVMGYGNSIPRAAKPENYRVLLETSLEYGRYPIHVEEQAWKG